MSKYGIPYQGSKDGIAQEIITFLPKGNRFVDLFGGGFAMSECALYSKKYKSVLYNELNPLLPKLIKKAIHGDYNYKVFKPKFITRDEFYKEKEQDGYIKYVWSFSNGGKEYLFGKDIEKQKESLHNYVVFGIKDDFIKYYFDDIDKYVNQKDIKARRLVLRRYIQGYEDLLNKHKQLERLERIQQLERLERIQQLERLGTLESCQQLEQLERLGTLESCQQLEQLERLGISNDTYLNYKYQDGDVVYCDPPYEDTATYSKDGFNHKEFYDWVATRPYRVYFSSYNNISDDRFKIVWAKGKRSLMSGASKNYKYECLYTQKEIKER